MPKPTKPVLSPYTDQLPDVNNPATWADRTPLFWNWVTGDGYTNMTDALTYSDDVAEYLDTALADSETLIDSLAAHIADKANPHAIKIATTLPEGASYERMRITVGSVRRSALVRVNWVARSGDAITGQNGGTALFSIERADGGASVRPMSIQNVADGAGSIGINTPVASGNDIIFGFFASSNGTGTTYDLNIDVEILSNSPSAFTVSEITGTNPSTSDIGYRQVFFGEEEESNANGRYRKFHNGFMICQLFQGQTSIPESGEVWTFPVPFVSQPTIAVSGCRFFESGVGEGYGIIAPNGNAAISTTSYSFRGHKLSGFGNRIRHYTITAIGRWI